MHMVCCMCFCLYVLFCLLGQAVLSADLGYLTNDQPPEVYYSFDSLITEVQKFAEHPQYIV